MNVDFQPGKCVIRSFKVKSDLLTCRLLADGRPRAPFPLNGRAEWRYGEVRKPEIPLTGCIAVDPCRQQIGHFSLAIKSPNGIGLAINCNSRFRAYGTQQLLTRGHVLVVNASKIRLQTKDSFHQAVVENDIAVIRRSIHAGCISLI
jgi:hypothetical protein